MSRSWLTWIAQGMGASRSTACCWSKNNGSWNDYRNAPTCSCWIVAFFFSVLARQKKANACSKAKSCYAIEKAENSWSKSYGDKKRA
jgi:hypothetical protein